MTTSDDGQTWEPHRLTKHEAEAFLDEEYAAPTVQDSDERCVEYVPAELARRALELAEWLRDELDSYGDDVTEADDDLAALREELDGDE